MKRYRNPVAAFGLFLGVALFGVQRPAAAQVMYTQPQVTTYAQPYGYRYVTPAAPGVYSTPRYVIPQGYYAPRYVGPQGYYAPSGRRVRRFGAGSAERYNWPTGRTVPMAKPWLR